MATEIFDLEVYVDYFLVAFRDVDTLAVTTFEQYEGCLLYTSPSPRD